MAEAPHGTAPALEGKDIANPMAMILACAAVLHYASEPGHAGPRARLARDLRGGARGDARPGVRTPDLGGRAARASSPTEVIARVRTKLEIWSSLGSAV